MKLHCMAAIVAAGFVVSTACFAQAPAEPTRAQVEADVARYEQAGFNPAREAPSHWVDDLQAASARVDAARGRSARSMRTASTGVAALPAAAD